MHAAQTASGAAPALFSLGGSARRERLLSKCSVFLAREVHLVVQRFGEDGGLFEEELHVHEARVLTRTKTNDNKVRQSNWSNTDS